MRNPAIATFGIVLSLASVASAQQPTWGTEPTQPGWGTQPTQPTQPTEPTQPGWGTQPTQPTQPGWGTQPTQPTQPGWGTEPSAPEGPEAPGDLLNFALGFSNHFGPTYVNSATLVAYPQQVQPGVAGTMTTMMEPVGGYANLSFKYRFTEMHEIEAGLGMAYIGPTFTPPGGAEEEEAGGFLFQIYPRYILTIVSNQRTRLYTGAGIGIIFATASSDPATASPPTPHGETNLSAFGFNLGIPLGFEYRFEAAPNLALTMELGLSLAYISMTQEDVPVPGSGAPTAEIDWSMFLFGLGQSLSVFDDIDIPIIDHLTFGLHYWF